MTGSADPAIDGLRNFRDTGGTPLHAGGATRPGVLFRSGALDSLTDAGLAHLAASTIGVIVDLRTPTERAMAPDRLPPQRLFRTARLPLLEGAMTGWAQAAGQADPAVVKAALREALESLPSLGDMYISMLDGGATVFAETARLVADPGDGENTGVLVHCTAGKDRTGIATALLLEAAGADRAAVVADYASSQARLAGPWAESTMDMLASLGVPRTPALIELATGTPAAAIEQALAWVDARGGAAAYLRTGGLSTAETAALRVRLAG
ncbi:tyrosine-protein phosphatase [Propionicicella superfundia]|uniref:tyrosine-protein phosphatase n=1 Tax=Propionicicella superfundia TaxID=348582 RepID=UPI0003F93205|nr:tyrosine-protein phosphatase [Propionicicella superfundia]